MENTMSENHISVRLYPERRGALLVEAALAVGIAISLIGLTVSINAEQERRTDAISIGAEKKIILDAARNLILDREEDLIEQLFQAAVTSGGPGQLTFTAQDLVNIGYIPESFVPGAAMRRLFQQDYVLLLRPVFRDDIATPAAVLEEIDMDPFGTGSINPGFIDGDLSNGELGIESVLFTTGGQPVPPGQGGRVLSAAQRINAGFITDATQSRGIGGTMNFNITGFQDFAEFSDTGQGRFASPVSLGSIGVIGSEAPSNIPELRETFLRCVGLTPGTDSFLDCIAAPRNEVFGDIVMRGVDTTGDGTEDRFSTIQGATRIMCRNTPLGVDDPVDVNAFLIDCSETEINGILNITGTEINFAGETLAEVREIAGVDEVVLTSDRISMRLPSGADRDLSRLPVSTLRASAREVFDVQECPSTDINGGALEPKADASVTALLDPWGRSVSGMFAIMERGDAVGASWTPDSDGGSWMLRILYALNSDFCSSDFANPIDINLTFDIPGDPGSNGAFASGQRPTICSGGNGFADIYEMYPVGLVNYAEGQVTLSCGTPD